MPPPPPGVVDASERYALPLLPHLMSPPQDVRKIPTGTTHSKPSKRSMRAVHGPCGGEAVLDLAMLAALEWPSGVRDPSTTASRARLDAIEAEIVLLRADLAS